MKNIQDMFKEIDSQGMEPYKALMKYCDSRVTADEGIPAVIGLDDLTASWNTTYKGAGQDEEFRFLMAAGAMVFASLYEQKTAEELGEYPGIAPAMSAMAEMFFHAGEDGRIVPYREVVKQFVVNQDGQEGGKPDGEL